MDKARLAEAEPIFHASADLAPEERDLFISKHCGTDIELRRLVESLLAHHDTGMGSFLQSPADDTGSETIPEVRADESISIGPYRVLETIGEGGMGTVFVAEQTRPVRRKVALKVIKPGMDSRQVVARFDVERQALAMMDHPNIARVLDAGETEQGRPYFVMDLVEGEPITDYCDRYTLSTKERLDLFIPVCHAVQHAHQKGIIHRDLKPSNILVALTDGRPVPRVIDFGIAKATTATLTEKTLFTQQGQLIGTPAYMSPEQAEVVPLDVDTRSDVYSLGVILYELLAGTLPFDPRTLREAGLAEIQRILREEEPPKPSTKVSTARTNSKEMAKRHRTDPRTLVHQLKGDLDWIVLRAIEKDRTRRYETASSLATDIGRYLRDEPVLASPPSTAYRIRKFARRHKVPLGFAATIFLGITLALLESNRQRTKTESALDRAQEARQETETALGEARQARDESKAVTEFLAEMLASVDPGAQGRDVSVKEVLDEASKTVGSEFENRPRIEAQLRHTIGRTYRVLGEFEAAESNQRLAVELRSAVLGDEHPETLRSKFEVAYTHNSRGRWDEAESLFRETLATQRRVLGEEHPEVLDSRDELAWVRYLRGQYDEAESTYLETLEIRNQVQGEEHPATLLTMESLAQVYWRQLRLDEAESLSTRILEISRRTLGEEHPETLDHKHVLAAVYWEQRRLEEAEALYREVLETQRRLRGDTHDKVLWLMHDLALVYVAEGRYQEGKALLREGLQGLQRVMGEDHVGVSRFLNNLAWASREQGRHAEAESLYRQALEGEQLALGEEHPRTIRTRFRLACVVAAQGRRDEALACLWLAVESGFSSADRLLEESSLASLRDDPEFEALVAEMRRRSHLGAGEDRPAR